MAFLASLMQKAITQTPEFARAFRERLAFLFTNVLALDKLTNRVHATVRRLQREAGTDSERTSLATRAEGFARRIVERHQSVAAQLAGLDITPIQLRPGASLPLTNWNSGMNHAAVASTWPGNSRSSSRASHGTETTVQSNLVSSGSMVSLTN